MKKTKGFSFLFIVGFVACSGSDDNPETIVNIDHSPTEISVTYEETIWPLHITCEREWMLYSDDAWIACAKNTTNSGGNAKATIAANTSFSEREGTIVIKSGNTRVSIPVKQSGKPEIPVDPTITVPQGYTLVWQDEFNDNALSMPDEKLWWYEVWGPGYVNNELQRYVKGKQADELTAEVSSGTLKIHAKKVGNEVISARVNTIEHWTYGYFEARLKLPVGKGTWPAFWMMPKQESQWPDCGEIDIMEEVGYHPNYVSSSIHCKAYNHLINTQKTKEILVPSAQTEFHVYALEWTADRIECFVDGKSYFVFQNDQAGNSATWPFNKSFYLKLNLAWGGDWGGAQGVDESALPATYEIDYVRVFQKK
jgi:hypothetical protein